MNPIIRTLILTLAILSVAALTSVQAELRFGPWVYWAPYYYPSPEKLQDLGFKPQDLAPRYQSPNPLPPKSDGDCIPPPPPMPRKVADSSSVKGQVSGPLTDVPGNGPPDTLRQSPASSLPVGARTKRVSSGRHHKPRSVGSDPGPERVFPAPSSSSQAP
jgi:hypothetical protein